MQHQISWTLEEIRVMMSLMTELDLENKLDGPAKKVMAKLASYMPVGDMSAWQDTFLSNLKELPWGARLAPVN